MVYDSFMKYERFVSTKILEYQQWIDVDKNSTDSHYGHNQGVNEFIV